MTNKEAMLRKVTMRNMAAFTELRLKTTAKAPPRVSAEKM